MVGHPLRVKDAVEMVAFVLYDAGMKPGGFTLKDTAVEGLAAIADLEMPRHHPAQPGNRQTALPAEHALAANRLDHRVDQRHQFLLVVARHSGEPLRPDKEDDEAI